MLRKTLLICIAAATLWPLASEAALELSFRHSRSTNIIAEGKTKFTFTAKTNEPARIEIYVNDTKLAEADNATELKETYNFTAQGDYEVKAIAKAGSETDDESLYLCWPGPSTAAADKTVPPMGITKNADGSLTFCLCAPQKDGVFLVGSFNDFRTTSKQQMQYVDKTESDNEIRYFKITLPKAELDDGFSYYYLVDGKAVGDPYALLVLDKDNDKYINQNSMVYPDLPEFPTKGVPSTLKTMAYYADDLLDYKWNVTDFKRADKEDLVIYEMLFRDFTGTEGKAMGNGTVREAIAKIPYLKELGVNAVELLPINEFNGNISWGYNPNYYFAPDKAYGTPQDYKEFIDRCHAEGIAVILDLVFNQTDWQHPWYQMYTVGENPFYNASAPHAFSVLNDWKQEYPPVQQQFRDVVKFWLKEYKVDGYRFDLVKGLGDNSSYANSSAAATGAYNASRVARMKNLHDAMREVAPDAYFINENLAGAKEENEMAADGELNWMNLNNNGCQYAMGYTDGASLTAMLATKGSRTAGSTVAYLESHDEERLAYKQITWGLEAIKNDHKACMQRCGSAAAQMILVPGAHMIWQFSEMGNAQSTKTSDGQNNTGPKTVNWALLDDPDNKGLMENYSEMIRIRTTYPELFTTTGNYENKTSAWSAGRHISTSAGDKELHCAINPNYDKNVTIKIQFASDDQDKYWVASKSYGSNPSFDAAAKTITLEPNCYAVITTRNVSGVEEMGAEIADNTLNVSTANGCIRYAGANGGVAVYTLQGAKVACSQAESGEIAAGAGLYIVKAGGKAVKVLVK